MICTVTLNPSLDYIVSVQNFRTGSVNRTCAEKLLPGGKGVNVSIVLKHFGTESVLFGFQAGFTGAELEQRLKALSLQPDFVAVKRGMTRINVKLRSAEETEINGMGPQVAEEELAELFRKLDGLSDGDVLVLAGNIPAGLPKELYGKISERLGGRGIRFVVDAAGESLLSALSGQPFLIKPNLPELRELFESPADTLEEIAECAGKLQKMGARNVLVSLAGDGALLCTEERDRFYCPAPAGTVVNSVGAGDSMVAGFLNGLQESGEYRHALAMGIAAGSASAFSEELADKKEMERLLLLQEPLVRKL